MSKSVMMTLGFAGQGLAFLLFASAPVAVAAKPAKSAGLIQDIRYVPGSDTQTLAIDYSGPAVMNLIRRPEAKQLIIEITGSRFPTSLARRIDASAMPGPVTEISPYNVGGELVGAKVVVQMRSRVEAIEEKAPGEYRIVFLKDEAKAKSSVAKRTPWLRRPGIRRDRDSVNVRAAATDKTLEAAEELIRTLDTPMDQRVYKGSKVTIESDSVDVHDVFRLVGAASGLNILTTSDVGGQVSLSLRDVPWDQLLDIVLAERQLKAVNNGNVIRITTIANYNREQEAKLALQVVEKKIEPVLMTIIPINYAKAQEVRDSIAKLLIGAIDGAPTGAAVPAAPGGAAAAAAPAGTQTATTTEEAVQAFARGKIEVEVRTNSLLVTHTAEQIKRIRALVKELDVPTPQVLIESKIIQASDNFSRSLGVNWGGFFQGGPPGSTNTNAGGAGFAVNTFNSAGSFAISNTGAGGVLGMRIGTGGQSALDFSVSLAELNSQAKVMASPRVIVNNNRAATITDGTQIAITNQTFSGGAVANTTTFVQANLTLNVTPQITNSGQVQMDLNVTQGVPVSVTGQSTPNISTKSINTNVLVDSGSTLVLGGVYSYNLNKDDGGIPWLKDLPILGQLFRINRNVQQRSEMLVFLTPRVIEASRVEEVSETEEEEVAL